MRKLAPAGAAAAVAALIVLPLWGAGEDGAGAAANSSLPDSRAVLLGHSVKGRAIRAVRIGDPRSPRKALVVGEIHGDEPAGRRVIRVLRRDWRNLRGVDLWLVASVNPDGHARETRKNAHGVDLNRNFSHRWRASLPPSSPYYQGPRPFSEPESRLVRRWLQRIRPRVTIWYHQPWGQVLAPCSGRALIEKRYSRLSGLPLKRCRGQGLPGTATKWQERHINPSQAFVVEFPSGPISSRTARRHARAAALVARDGVGRGGAEGIGPRRSPAVAPLLRYAQQTRHSPDFGAEAEGRNPLRRIKPKIVDWLIPYGARRKRDMAAYSARHYGRREWRLRRVELIVQHYSVTSTAAAVYNTFAPNRPDVEYGELPGVCAHYVISPAGRIFRLVPLGIRCRHVVGLNHLSVGIEHVGHSDAEVMGRERQLRASLRLSRWLRCRFGLGTRRVIGHNESLRSPFYFELDPDFRGRTHADFRRKTMNRYRRLLRGRGGCP